MTNDDLDIDLDTPEAPDTGLSAKPSLKEMWETNPMLKLAAVVLTVAVIGGGVMIFSSGDSEEKKSVISVADVSGVKQIPGQKELDPAYKKALEETNKRAAEMAAKTGESALPIPIGTVKTGGLDMSDMPSKPKSDPLAEWRKQTETRRKTADKKTGGDAGEGPPPETVPMVQPIRPQQIYKQDPGVAKALADQMRVIIAAQVPPKQQAVAITKKDSAYIEEKLRQEELKAKGLSEEDMTAGGTAAKDTASGKDGTDEKEKVRKIVTAGTIAYIQLINELNSDIQGPVLAQVLSGPFAGGRVLGKIDVKDEYMVLTFDRIIKDTVTYSISGIAMDEKSTLTGVVTDVEHHYFDRVVLPAAAKFIEGYSAAIAETGTETTQTSGGGQASSTPKPSPKESIYKGMEESAKIISEMLAKGKERPITVKIARGTTMGMFFMDTVTTKDVEE